MPDDPPRPSALTRAADIGAGALPLNRIVALAAPVAATAAAVAAGLIVDILSSRTDRATRRAVMLAASASTTAIAHKWLEGWQRYEHQEFLVENGLITTDGDPIPLAELAVRGDDHYRAMESEFPRETGDVQ